MRGGGAAQPLVRDHKIFMSYTRPVCQLNDPKRTYVPYLLQVKKDIVPFKVKEKSHSPVYTLF